jgi:NADH:ubiquinone oxidoreductase subunit 3 (subunit A)
VDQFSELVEKYLLSPPVAFVILLGVGGLLYWCLGRLAPKTRGAGEEGLKPYSCGEEMPSHMIQPNYGQFLPFAFFFTILHVVALMVTTAAGAATAGLTAAAFLIAAVYVVGAVVGLVVLYRN